MNRRRYAATERAWVKALLRKLTPEQYARYVEAMKKEAGYYTNGKKYDRLKAEVAERILWEDTPKRGGPA